MTTIIACVEPGLKQAVLIAFEIKPKASTEFSHTSVNESRQHTNCRK